MVISRKLSIMIYIKRSKARSADVCLISNVIRSLRLITYFKKFNVFEPYINAFKYYALLTLLAFVQYVCLLCVFCL